MVYKNAAVLKPIDGLARHLLQFMLVKVAISKGPSFNFKLTAKTVSTNKNNNKTFNFSPLGTWTLLFRTVCNQTGTRGLCLVHPKSK